MLSLGRIYRAFLIRDFQLETSYRLAFVLGFSGVFLQTFSFFFISRVFSDSPMLDDYNGDYFAFAIIGLAITGYFTLGLEGFASTLRRAQTTGTLEALIMTPVRLSVIVTGSAVWSYLFTTFRVLIFLVLGVSLGVQLDGANWSAAIVLLLISIVAFAATGILAAAFIMVLKKGNPVTFVFGSLSSLVGGTWYPVEVLPDWLEPLSRVIPLTHALEGMRRALLNGAPWSELVPYMNTMLFFCLILMPISLWAFRYSVRLARADGSLTHY